MTEIEAKILEINTNEVTKKLKDLGAKFNFLQEFYAIYFDDPNQSLSSKKKILRLRREGPRTMITYKAPTMVSNAGISTREELEVPVADFETMRTILEKLGYEETIWIKKFRTEFELGKAFVMIDRHVEEYAHIPTYMEIEAPSQAILVETAEQLGFSRADLKDWSILRVMEHYADKKA